MNSKRSRPIFTIRRIANRNPRLPRFYRASKQKILRLALVVFLAVAGVASLLFFNGNVVNQHFDSSFISADTTDVLGEGFEKIGGFSGEATNPGVEKKENGFKEEGIKTVNSVLYNIKDYIKFIAGSIAVLYLIISALHIVLSQDNEGIEKAKKNMGWSLFALVLIFIIDTIVIAFFEGGGGAPGQSLVTVTDGKPEQTLNLFENISLYFKVNARTIFSYIKTIVGAIAILFIVFAGIQMITAGGSEEKIEKEKKYLMHLITAFVTILMLDTMIFGFIYPENRAGENDPLCVEFINFTTEGSFDLHVMSGTDAQQIMKNYGVSSEYELMDRIEGCRSAAELGLIGSNQILGLVRFFETLIGAVAIFFIVYSGVAIIASMGEEETIKKHRKTLLWSFIGLAIVILANTVITRFFFVVDPITGNAGIDTATGIYTIAGITNFIAGFVGVFAVVAIIVAGIIWVANFGNDEIANKAKKIILSAVIGVVLAVSAYAIVNTLTSARSKGGSGTSIGISI